MQVNLRSFLSGGICAALLGAVFSFSAAAQSGYGVNLIQNPGAEDGAADPGGEKVLPVPSWTHVAGSFTTAQWGGSGLPAANDPGPEDRGKNLFYGGPGGAKSSASQKIELTIPPADVDTGTVSYKFSAWLGGFSNQGDYATVTAEFLNTAGKAISSAMLGPVTVKDRKSTTRLLEREKTGMLPKGTRSILVTIAMTRLEGNDNDGSVDNLSLVLTK